MGEQEALPSTQDAIEQTPAESSQVAERAAVAVACEVIAEVIAEADVVADADADADAAPDAMPDTMRDVPPVITVTASVTSGQAVDALRSFVPREVLVEVIEQAAATDHRSASPVVHSAGAGKASRRRAKAHRDISDSIVAQSSTDGYAALDDRVPRVSPVVAASSEKSQPAETAAKQPQPAMVSQVLATPLPFAADGSVDGDPVATAQKRPVSWRISIDWLGRLIQHPLLRILAAVGGALLVLFALFGG